ncbi:uncharacterized protein ACBR49_019489 [Aulostomus maculatus]
MLDLEEERASKVRICPGKKSLEQRSLSLNITAGSSAPTGEKSRTFSQNLCPITGSFDESELSITTTSIESSEAFPNKTETSSNGHEQSDSFSETLDLAGALPWPSLEKREADKRRKSVPANVSPLVGGSLAKLSFGDQTSRENPLEELGYCVFNEYSGPMPSPADVPSPGESPRQCFLAMVGEVEKVPGATEVKGMQQEDPKATVPDIPQKVAFEKKDAHVKTSMILEKAVTSGIKPDRLRIPITTPKDRLTEFRLESGLPDDIKIQAIPEVDVEKDPSREASPIPPDSSFTFTENGGKVPLTPTTPKSTEGTPSDDHVTGEKARKVKEVEAESKLESERFDKKQMQSNKEMQKSDLKVSEDPQKAIKEKDNGIPEGLEGKEKQEPPKVVEDLSPQMPSHEKNNQIQLEDSAKPKISSPVIIIPQAQVEEEAEEEDDIEIAEEPQEIMEDVEVLPKTEQQKKGKEVRLLEAVPMTEEDPKSGEEEWSRSAQNSDDGELATDSSHLSPCSDRDLTQPPEDGGRGAEVAEVPQINREQPEGDGVKKEEQISSDDVVEAKEEKKREEEEVRMGEDDEKDIEVGQEVVETSDVLCKEANDETTMDVSIFDSDSGWMDSKDDDKSIMSEQIEALPQTQSPTSTPVVDKPAKRAPGRGRGGHLGTTDCKVSRRVPSHHPREEMKKKKVGIRRADQSKVSALQSRSPSRKNVAKAAARHPRPALLHGSARRKAPATLDLVVLLCRLFAENGCRV